MKVQELTQVIRAECLDEEGFLVLLHAWRRFDDDKYQRLIGHIEEYAQLLGDRQEINRDVATCLFELMTAIDTALAVFGEAEHPELPKVERAHGQVSELLHNRIFSFSKPA